MNPERVAVGGGWDASGMPSLDFEYEILLCRDFDDVLTGTGRPVSVKDFVERAVRKGRVLLQAAGGSGKTHTLLRIREWATQNGYRSAVIDVQRLSSKELRAGAIDSLLRLAQPSLSYEDLATDEPLLLLVDGLAEVSRTAARSVIDAIDQWAALAPRTGTIVADRLVRREIRMHRWLLASLSRVPASRIRDLLGRDVGGAELALLGTPLFLRLTIEDGASVELLWSRHMRRLLGAAQLTAGELDALADFALETYRRGARRSFPRANLEAAVGRASADRLTERGLIHDISGEQTTFSHHMLHDYLAARSAAKRPDEWGHELFETLSLSNSSNEALVMLLEQTPAESRGKLVRLVYDWNLYAASYLLSRDRKERGISDPVTEHEILALLGERRFDFFLASRRQVEDALRLHASTLASAYLGASSITEVIELARAHAPQSEEFHRWLGLFGERRTPCPMHIVRTVTDSDGVAGWTAANVIRRLGADGEAIAALSALASSPNNVVRWRSVHALGAVGASATERLFESLDNDPVTSVRYGALRSLVEHAYKARSPESRRDIFKQLAARSEALRTNRSLAAELARVLEVASPPADWASAAGQVLESLLATEEDPGELEKWRTVASSLLERQGE